MSEAGCPFCGAPVPENSEACPTCGKSLITAPPVDIGSAPPTATLAPPLATPVPPMAGARQENYPGQAQLEQSNSLSGIIPSKNPDSLWAYYLGLFSIFPFFGLFMGAVAMFKGGRAFKQAKTHPEDKGKTHAVVGIGCGLIGFLFNLSWIVLLLVILITDHGKSSP